MTRTQDQTQDHIVRPTSYALQPGTILCQAGAALLAAAFVVSFAVSPDHRASLPWTILGLAGSLSLLVLSGPGQRWAARLGNSPALPWLFVAFGGTALAVALFATEWPTHKLAWLEKLYGSLPSVRMLPWWDIAGLQANQTGGILAVCTAFAFAIIGDRSAGRRLRWSAGLLALLGAFVVFITGSRAALAGLLIAGLVVAIVHTRRWLWAWGTGMALAGWLLLVSGRLPTLGNLLFRDESLEIKMVARLDIWLAALRGIEDHFFTGIGLGVFNQVMPFRYPYETVGLGYSVSQAHNVFLDVALCLGIPGLLGFLMVIVGIAASAVRGLRIVSPGWVTSLGILASLIAYLVFGITDSISFTVPTSLIVWIWGITLCGVSQAEATHRETR